jgi:hypothetical protein
MDIIPRYQDFRQIHFQVKLFSAAYFPQSFLRDTKVTMMAALRYFSRLMVIISLATFHLSVNAYLFNG